MSFLCICQITICFTISTSILRVLIHFYHRALWKENEIQNYAEFMFQYTKSDKWQRRMKKHSAYYNSVKYTLSVVFFNLILILIAVGFIFLVLWIMNTDYSVWMYINI